jgi:hypothetical protein
MYKKNRRMNIKSHEYSVYNIVFSNNTLYHEDGTYFFIRTPLSRIVLASDEGETPTLIWIELSNKICDFIDSIDLRYISEQSSTLKGFLKISHDFIPSLKKSTSGRRCLLAVNLRSYTNIIAPVIKNTYMSLTLQVNYCKNALIWNAYEIKGLCESDIEDEIIFPNCLLEPELIKI